MSATFAEAMDTWLGFLDNLEVAYRVFEGRVQTSALQAAETQRIEARRSVWATWVLVAATWALAIVTMLIVLIDA